MRKLLFFVLALAVLSTASSVELQNICPHDTFKYQDVLVNAFHRVRQSFTFEPIGAYMLNDSIACNRSEFRNEKNFFKVLPRIKENYNLKMAQILSPYFMRSASQSDLDNEFNELQDLYYQDFGSLMEQEDKQACLISHSGVMFSGLYFILNQQPYLKDQLQQEDDSNLSPLKKDLMRKLEKTIAELNIDNSTQLFSFASDSLPDIYRRQIVLKRELTFAKRNSKALSYDARPVIHYDLILPFHTQAYNDSEPCYSYRELPLFFKNKVNW